MSVSLPVLPSWAPHLRKKAGHFDTGPRSISAVRVLRISVTDRCNFRCLYCMPEAGVPWLPRAELLSVEEIVAVARAAAEAHGIRRFKLTGGEPTLRPELVEIVRRLREVAEELSLTTNGMLLGRMAGALKEAGLDRATVSLDSLSAERFRRITRTGDLATVLAGLDMLEQAGFKNTKVNCVTMRGTNEDEVAAFAALTRQRALTVRFIEYMPLGDAALQHEPGAAAEHGPAAGCAAQARGEGGLVPEAEVREAIERACGKLMPAEERGGDGKEAEAGVGPARVYRLAGARGRIGFISAMSAPFCATCNRLRLTADGRLRSCLFEGGEVHLRKLLRGETVRGRQRALAEAMVACVRLKPAMHGGHGNQQMSRIGG